MCMEGDRPGCVCGLGSLDVNAVPALYNVAIVVAGLILDSFLVFKMSGSNAGSTEMKKINTRKCECRQYRQNKKGSE